MILITVHATDLRAIGCDVELISTNPQQSLAVEVNLEPSLEQGQLHVGAGGDPDIYLSPHVDEREVNSVHHRVGSSS